MKLNFKTVSTFLILVLTITLVIFLISYYNTPIRVVSPVSDVVSNHQDNPKKIKQTGSGEKNGFPELTQVNNADSEPLITQSGEISSSVSKEREDIINTKEGEKQPEIEKVPEPETTKVEDNQATSQVIISSEDTMTNKEKREILTELDNTLMELLDVVDQVQQIDETRLITGESEVQP